MFDLTY